MSIKVLKKKIVDLGLSWLFWSNMVYFGLSDFILVDFGWSVSILSDFYVLVWYQWINMIYSKKFTIWTMPEILDSRLIHNFHIFYHFRMLNGLLFENYYVLNPFKILTLYPFRISTFGPSQNLPIVDHTGFFYTLDQSIVYTFQTILEFSHDQDMFNTCLKNVTVKHIVQDKKKSYCLDIDKIVALTSTPVFLTHASNLVLTSRKATEVLYYFFCHPPAYQTKA